MLALGVGVTITQSLGASRPTTSSWRASCARTCNARDMLFVMLVMHAAHLAPAVPLMLMLMSVRQRTDSAAWRVPSSGNPSGEPR
jgi:hypothetical protein